MDLFPLATVEYCRGVFLFYFWIRREAKTERRDKDEDVDVCRDGERRTEGNKIYRYFKSRQATAYISRSLGGIDLDLFIN